MKPTQVNQFAQANHHSQATLSPQSTKPQKSLGVFKFASCDGCQLSLLACEDELLELAGKIHIAHFLEASSRIEPGPYDIALVEGSITTSVA
jgi:sulfhydrogenase subunit delta